MDEKVYLHAIYAISEIYNSKMTLMVLKSILESNALLSARLQHKRSHNVLFNGMDYISLCDYEKRDKFLEPKHNSYEMYIRYSLSLIFPKEKVDAIVPEMIEISYRRGYQQVMGSYGMDEDKRYSDLPDEVQVKDRVSLDNLTGITVPISKFHTPFFLEGPSIKYAIQEITKIRSLLDTYHINVPIYDIDTLENVESEETVKKLVRYYMKNRG